MEETSTLAMLVRATLSLGGVIALILALSYIAKKYLQPGRWSGSKLTNIQVVESLPIEPRKRLMVISVQNKKYLIGVSEHNISYLCALESEFDSNKLTDFEQVLGVEEVHHDPKAC